MLDQVYDTTGRTILRTSGIDYGRTVLFFDDDTYFVTPGTANVPLTDVQKVTLGIITSDELDGYIEARELRIQDVMDLRNIVEQEYPEVRFDIRVTVDGNVRGVTK